MNRRSRYILFIFLCLSCSPACADVFVPAEAHALLSWTRSYHKTISDLETFFRLVIPRLGATLDKETKKDEAAVIQALREHDLFPAGLPVEIKIYFAETRQGALFLTKPENLSFNSEFFIAEVIIPCNLPPQIKEELARQRSGRNIEGGILFRFLPSIIDIPSLMLKTTGG